MYAVVRTGGKQHRVEKGDKIKIEKIDGEVGAEVKFDDVLMLGGNGTIKVGQPTVQNANVTAKILAQAKGPKIRIHKKRKRKGFHKTVGHRQLFTQIEVTGISG